MLELPYLKRRQWMHRSVMILLMVIASLYGDAGEAETTDLCKAAIENPNIAHNKAEALCRELALSSALERSYSRAAWYDLFTGEGGYRQTIGLLSHFSLKTKDRPTIAYAYLLDGNLSQAVSAYGVWLEHAYPKVPLEGGDRFIHSDLGVLKEYYPDKSALITKGDRAFKALWEKEIKKHNEKKALQKKIYSCLYVVPYSSYRKRAPKIIGDLSNAKADCDTFLAEKGERRMAQKLAFASLIDQNLSRRVVSLADSYFRQSDLQDTLHLRKRVEELYSYTRAVTRGCTICKKLKRVWKSYAIDRILKQNSAYASCFEAYQNHTDGAGEVCRQKGAEALKRRHYAIAFWLYGFGSAGDRFYQTLAYEKGKADLVGLVGERLTSVYGIPKEKIAKVRKGFKPLRGVEQTYQGSYCLYAIDRHFEKKKREAICYNELFQKEAMDLDDLLLVYDTNLTQEAIERVVAEAIRHETFSELQHDRESLKREIKNPALTKLNKRLRAHLLSVIRRFDRRLAAFDDELDYYRQYEQRGDWNVSLKLLQKIVPLEEQSPCKSAARMATLYTAMGYAYEKLGEHNRSIVYYRNALSIYHDTPVIEDKSAEVWEYLSDLYHAAGDEHRAISYIDQALNAIGRERYPERARLLVKRAEAEMAAHQKERSSHTIEDAIRDLYRVVDLSQSEEITFTMAYEPYNALSHAYRLQQQPKEEFIYAVEAMERFLKNYYIHFGELSVREKEHYFRERLPQMERILQLAEGLRKAYTPRIGAAACRSACNSWIEMKNAYFTHSSVISRYGAVTQAPDYRVRAESLSPLRSESEALYAALLKGGEFEAYREKMADIRKTYRTVAPILLMEAIDRFRLRHQEVDVDRLAKYLREDQLYLDFVALEDRYALFVIDHNATVTLIAYDANKSREIDTLAQNIVQGLTRFNQIRAVDEANLTTLRHTLKARTAQLARVLIPHSLTQRLQGKRSLVISPDGRLWHLPFGLLYDPKECDFMMDRYRIEYAPSVAVFVNEKAKAKPNVVVAIPGVGE